MTERFELRSFEGHRVGLRFVDGTRIECQLISAPRHGLSTMWVLDGDGVDRFIHVDAVAEIWTPAEDVMAIRSLAS
jgi:hypothetical protein